VPATAERATGALLDRLRPVLLLVSVGLLLLVALSRPNAAAPDLAPRGWAPGPPLPLTLGPAAVTATLWTAYLVGAAAVALGLARPHATRPLPWLVPVGLGALALLGAPTGSADHVNYAAYGRILVSGGDPWVEPPQAWAGGADPVTSRVEEPWTTEPSVYGPFATALHGLAALVGDGNLRQTVWVWQVVVVLAWLGVRAALRAALGPEQDARVDVVWTTNPLVLSAGLLGAHVDTVATALAVAAVWAAVRWRGPAGAVAAGVLVALAGCTKFTYAVVAVGVLVAVWWRGGPLPGRARGGAAGRAARLRWTGAFLGAVVVVVVGLHLWAGPHVYDQLGAARRSISLASPWRLVLEALRSPLGEDGTRTLVAVLSAVLAVALAWALFRLSGPAPARAAANGHVPDTDPGTAGAPSAADRQVRGTDPVTFAADRQVRDTDPVTFAANRQVRDTDPVTFAANRQVRDADAAADAAGFAPVALWVTGVLAAAYALAAAYTLPWYDLLAWACLPAVVGPALDATLLARLTVMSMAYVPGRVLGMTPAVEALTLGARRHVAPWLLLALWAAVLTAAARPGWARRLAPRPRGSAPPPR
jgi:hypothetical protein